ncbi:Type II secretion system (T2SS), protein F [Desulforamulus putei DSM 12395]|uniref:Type II secretion system (T2SS), protein F n=1 Tax=Desulforamulus putei DSM 12395 TaxID=1121429 RepID=A0A1M5DBD1_9FIRM|nr:type II secretion system F family protein [Desulforamulus putei]SHF63992.1 Type II secretion system (T2SS), protein F [Desulforamulus putei DSM 12395]
MLTLAVLCISLAVLLLVLGPKLSPVTKKEVRITDQHIEVSDGKTAKNNTLLIALLGSIIGAVLAYAITGNLLLTLVGLSCGYFALKWAKTKRERERLELLQSQYPDVLSQLEAATAGSLNSYQALEDAVPNLPRPARDIFYEVLTMTRISGVNVNDALEKVADETGWHDLRSLAMGFRLSTNMGINLSTICKHLLESHYEKESYRGQIRGAISQNIMTIRVLSGLPFLVIGLARIFSPEFAEPLFNTLGGVIFFLICVGMIAAGNVVAKKMIYRTMGG